jgi:hypothetical protein
VTETVFFVRSWGDEPVVLLCDSYPPPSRLRPKVARHSVVSHVADVFADGHSVSDRAPTGFVSSAGSVAVEGCVSVVLWLSPPVLPVGEVDCERVRRTYSRKLGPMTSIIVDRRR